MPVYEYRCQECGSLSEVLLRSFESKPEGCPSCGSTKLERLLSAAHLMRSQPQRDGTTCCGREERCETPPCSDGEGCRRRS